MGHAVIASQLSGVEILTGSTYKSEKTYITHVGLMNLIFALLEPDPDAPEANSSASVVVNLKNWKRQIDWVWWLSKDPIRYYRGSIHDKGNVKEFLDATEKNKIRLK